MGILQRTNLLISKTCSCPLTFTYISFWGDCNCLCTNNTGTCGKQSKPTLKGCCICQKVMIDSLCFSKALVFWCHLISQLSWAMYHVIQRQKSCYSFSIIIRVTFITTGIQIRALIRTPELNHKTRTESLVTRKMRIQLYVKAHLILIALISRRMLLFFK